MVTLSLEQVIIRQPAENERKFLMRLMSGVAGHRKYLLNNHKGKNKIHILYKKTLTMGRTSLWQLGRENSMCRPLIG